MPTVIDKTYIRTRTVKQRLLTATLVIVWAAAAVSGLLLLVGHSNAPGPSTSPHATWPADSGLTLDKVGDTLVVFAHPRCPCTRASLGELEKIVAGHPRGLKLWVLFYEPGDVADWPHTDLWDTAAALPDAHVVADLDGKEARRFNAATSGQTLLYNAQGRLLFAGGITAARGHAGDNAGRFAIETLLAGGRPDYDRTPVFGCPIVTDEPEPLGAP